MSPSGSSFAFRAPFYFLAFFILQKALAQDLGCNITISKRFHLSSTESFFDISDRCENRLPGNAVLRCCAVIAYPFVFWDENKKVCIQCIFINTGFP